MIMQDIRLTLKRLSNLDCAPLAVMDADAVDAIKDLYYVVSNEDPLNVQPARKLLHEQHVVATCLLPLLAAIDSDTNAAENHKRWSVCLYHTFRALSALTTPVHPENELLKPGCSLDTYLIDARVELVRRPRAVQAVVALLQYYVERKADKMARFAPAEESKVEDARIENILAFFRHILAPPRTTKDRKTAIAARDVPIHFALVGVLHEADFYSTITVLFSASDEARGHLTKLVFVVAEVLKNTFRLSSAKEVASYSLLTPKQEIKKEKIDPACGDSKPEPASEPEDGEAKQPETVEDDEITEGPNPKQKSVFDDDFSDAEAEPESKPKPEQKQPNAPRNRQLERRQRRAAGLREAMLRERKLIGGSRAVVKSARWTNKHSGSFIAVRQSTDPGSAGGSSASGSLKAFAKPIVGGASAVEQSASGPLAELRASFQLSSDLLGAATAAKPRIARDTRQANQVSEIRTGLVDVGRRALADVAAEHVDEGAFGVFIRELRTRIIDLVSKRTAAESEELPGARRAFLAVVAVAVGFARERVALRAVALRRRPRPSLHKGVATDAASDACEVGAKWTDVEAGLELESFQLVFDSLMQFSRTVREGAEDVMLATCALRQCMKLVHCLVRFPESEDDVTKEWEALPDGQRKKRPRLTGREFALNTLEYLFEREDYLNAPCDLAKQFDAKFHTFVHLANVVEVAYAFTATLRDEELEKIKVLRKKRKRKPKKKGKNKNDDKQKDSEGKDKDNENEEYPFKQKEDDNEDPFKQKEKEDDEDPFKQKDEEKNGNVGEEGNNPDVPETEKSKDVTMGDESNQTNEPGPDSEQPKEKDASAQLGNGNSNGEPDTNDKDVEVVEDPGQSESEPEAEPEQVEKSVESIGVIRRFAHSRALQVLALPLRAAFCKASTLSGALYPVPDGARVLSNAAIAGKSAAVLQTIWGTSGGRDKGALRGHFFTFGLLQVLHLSMSIADRKRADSDSVVGRLAKFSAVVTRELRTWLQVNPGLALDIFLGMDKMTCQTYAHSIQARNKVLTGGFEEKNGSDTSDAEDVMDEIERRAIIAANADDSDSDAEARARRREELRERKETRRRREEERQSRKIQEQRRREPRPRIEDDDVDDIDALNIGARDEDEEDEEDKNVEPTKKAEEALLKSTTPRAQRWKKRKSMTPLDMDFGAESSDEEGDEKKKRSRKKRKSNKDGNAASAGSAHNTPASKKKRKKKQVVDFAKSLEFEDDGDDEMDYAQVENLPLALLAQKMMSKKQARQTKEPITTTPQSDRKALLEADIASAQKNSLPNEVQDDNDAEMTEANAKEPESEPTKALPTESDVGATVPPVEAVNKEKDKGLSDIDTANNANPDTEADGDDDLEKEEVTTDAKPEADNSVDVGATNAVPENPQPETPTTDRKAMMNADIESARKTAPHLVEPKSTARRIVLESDSESE